MKESKVQDENTTPEPVLLCSFDLPPPVRERLLRLGRQELARRYEGRAVVLADFRLCPVCLAPTWASSSLDRSEGVARPTITAEIDRTSGGLCAPCEDTRIKFPDVFQWVVYVLGMRGLIGGEETPR